MRFLNRSLSHRTDAPALYQVRFEWVPTQGKPWFEDHIGDEACVSVALLLFASLHAHVFAVCSTSKEATPEPSSPASDAASLDSGFVDIMEPNADQESTDEGFVTCEACHQTHRRVYQEHVSCYNEACSNFFLVSCTA